MIWKLILIFFIQILLLWKALALPIGFIILWWESLIFIMSIISSVFFSVFFYFKSLSILNKIILLFTLIILILVSYFEISERYYKDKIIDNSNNISNTVNSLP